MQSDIDPMAIPEGDVEAISPGMDARIRDGAICEIFECVGTIVGLSDKSDDVAGCKSLKCIHHDDFFD
jgi:hypothetical protein